MYRKRNLPLCALMSGWMLLTGCSKPQNAMNEQVEGTVKLDGQPLANVTVQFVPDSDRKGQGQAPQSTATTDASGHFVLTCENLKSGAVLGRHFVVVLAGRGGDSRTNDMDPPAKGNAGNSKLPQVPQVYTMLPKTPLQVDVTAEQHSYPLNLSSNAAPRKQNAPPATPERANPPAD
jgi:hypothetical protein